MLGILLATVLLASAMPASAAPSYQVVSNDPDGLEVRFYGLPMRSAHADDYQNALSIDFVVPVDGALFERLQDELPQWISTAYANFDIGVIRSPRPVTFLARPLGDGFSLRIMARGPATDMPPPMRGSQ
jgi:hypothetical protein